MRGCARIGGAAAAEEALHGSEDGQRLQAMVLQSADEASEDFGFAIQQWRPVLRPWTGALWVSRRGSSCERVARRRLWGFEGRLRGGRREQSVSSMSATGGGVDGTQCWQSSLLLRTCHDGGMANAGAAAQVHHCARRVSTSPRPWKLAMVEQARDARFWRRAAQIESSVIGLLEIGRC